MKAFWQLMNDDGSVFNPFHILSQELTMKRIYVGNLNLLTNASQVQALFESYGSVLKAGIICDRNSGESLGFAYVLMSNDTEGNEAIQQLNGVSLDGRPLDVQEALPPEGHNKDEKRFHGLKLRARVDRV
jgi:RNA recognition motif-containing protein